MNELKLKEERPGWVSSLTEELVRLCHDGSMPKNENEIARLNRKREKCKNRERVNYAKPGAFPSGSSLEWQGTPVRRERRYRMLMN